MSLFDDILVLSDKFEKLAAESRGDCVFKANTGKNKSSKDRFPINNEAQARNALSRASQYSSVPAWYDGDLQSLVSAVARKVHAKYPGIKETSKSKTPGKG